MENVHPAYFNGATSALNVASLKPHICSTPLELAERRTSRIGQKSSRKGVNTAIEPFVLGGDEDDLFGIQDADYEQVIGSSAVWCTPEHYEQEPQVKRLYGEVHLPRGLQPTCAFPLFSILVCALSYSFVFER